MCQFTNILVFLAHYFYTYRRKEVMKYKVNTKLSVVNYMLAVEDIAAAYFDDKGNYTPAIGKINSMKVFYDYCVVDDNKTEINEISDIEPIINDELFIEMFNNAVDTDSLTDLDFANALEDAMKIVEYKNSTLGGVVNLVLSKLESLADSVSPMLTEENIAAVSKIAGDIGKGNVTASAIVDAYADKFYKEEK